MCTKYPKLENKQHITYQVLIWQYCVTPKFGIPDPKTTRNDVIIMKAYFYFPAFWSTFQNGLQKYPNFGRKKFAPNFFTLTECQRIT